MSRMIFGLLTLLLIGTGSFCPATAQPILFNTGINTNGTVLKEGAIDPHWQLASGPGPSAVLTSAYAVTNDAMRPFVWLPDMPTSRWISPQSSMVYPIGTGEFRYRTSFDLTGSDPASTTLRLMVASDDEVTAVLLNDQTTGISFTNGPAVWGVKDLFGGFQSSTNTLELVVTNRGGASGLNCRLSVIDAPLALRVQPLGTNLIVSWTTNAPCYVLESTTDLGAGLWVTEAATPTLVDSHYESVVPIEQTPRYFRLRRPTAPLPTPAILVNEWLGDEGSQWVQYGCPGSLGCAISAIDAGDLNTFDASSSIDWARCSTNDPSMEYHWSIYFAPEHPRQGALYRSARVQGRDTPVLTLPPNSLPLVIPTTINWTAELYMVSRVDPALSKTVRFQFRYVHSEMTLQDYDAELANGE